MPAAQSLHHGFSGGLVEHIWSVTRVCTFLIKHYAEYYDNLNPPLDRDVVVAAAILHDIGKLRELDYHPVEAKYTKHGTLIGHIVLGRDMIRDKAREIGEFPEETLLLLEHAILAHHGRMEFGAPKEPATLEALIVHYADEIDAKINAVASERMRSTTEGEFTGKIFAVGNRTVLQGDPGRGPVRRRPRRPRLSRPGRESSPWRSGASPLQSGRPGEGRPRPSGPARFPTRTERCTR